MLVFVVMINCEVPTKYVCMHACSSAGNLTKYTVAVVDNRRRGEILTPINSMATVLWGVMPCNLVQYKLLVLVEDILCVKSTILK